MLAPIDKHPCHDHVQMPPFKSVCFANYGRYKRRLPAAMKVFIPAPYRFLTTPETFYIVAFKKSFDGSMIVDAGGVVLPIQKGDGIAGTVRADQWDERSIDQSGMLAIDTPQSQVDHAWAF